MRASRETLRRATAQLQGEVEARVFEGAWDRVRRYFHDKELAKRIILARSAKKALDRIEKSEAE